MSGTGENRQWRRSSHQPQTQPPPQRGNQGQANDRSGSNTPRGAAQAMNAVPGNVWGVEGKGKPGMRGGEVATPTTNTAQAVRPPAVATQVQEKHTPVKEFNAKEVREFLKGRYQEAIADQPSAYHKVEGDSVAKRSSGAWGSRGNMSHQMPNGQDFFTQLKKQLQNFETSKG